jgi:hypothetical protein
MSLTYLFELVLTFEFPQQNQWSGVQVSKLTAIESWHQI